MIRMADTSEFDQPCPHVERVLAAVAKGIDGYRWYGVRLSRDGEPTDVVAVPDLEEILGEAHATGRLVEGITHGDPFLSPWQTNPTAGTPEGAAAQLDMAGDLDRALKAREDEGRGRHDTRWIP